MRQALKLAAVFLLLGLGLTIAFAVIGAFSTPAAPRIETSIVAWASPHRVLAQRGEVLDEGLAWAWILTDAQRTPLQPVPLEDVVAGWPFAVLIAHAHHGLVSQLYEGSTSDPRTSVYGADVWSTVTGVQAWTPTWRIQWRLALANVLVIAMIACAIWVSWNTPAAMRRARRTRRGACLRCGYDLRGGGLATCPECGAASR
jgi:hypothetical protein